MDKKRNYPPSQCPSPYLARSLLARGAAVSGGLLEEVLLLLNRKAVAQGRHLPIALRLEFVNLRRRPPLQRRRLRLVLARERFRLRPVLPPCKAQGAG